MPNELPPRTSSRNEGRSSPAYYDRQQGGVERFDSRSTMNSSGSSMSSTTAQNMSVVAPYPDQDTMPGGPSPKPPPHTNEVINGQNFPHPPPPPPKQQDALLALQRGGDLERRASRRFSTYQIKQQLGGGANGVPMIPPAQNSPIPNRGREVRESIQAVRQRGSQIYQRGKAERRLVGEQSPVRNAQTKLSEESLQSNKQAEPEQPESPIVQTPEDKLGPSFRDFDRGGRPSLGATVSGPVDVPSITETPAPAASAVPARRPSRKQAEPPSPEQFVPEESPQPGRPLTLFLQYKSKVKKIILDDGASDLSVARLQLAFIDKFAWNAQGDGQELPEIYIQDSVSGVRYELEDLGDIKQNTVLVLNVEPLDEVKKHIDTGLNSLRTMVEGIRTAVNDQQSAIQRVNANQQEAAKELAGLSVAPRLPTSPRPPTAGLRSASPTKISADALGDIQTLRRDLAVMRQTYSGFVSDVNASMATIRTKAASVKSTALKVSLPEVSGETGRAYVKQGLDSLAKEQEKIVVVVDDVQDLVEDLRKDVVTRGVRPLPRQLEQVAKDIADATAAVKRMEERLAKEKPIYSKIWKQELQQVYEDGELIKDVEGLISDFKLDLESADQIFKLVEEATKQQNLVAAPADGGAPIAPRNISGGGARIAALNMDRAVDPRIAKASMLGEVQGLKIDHEERLEAIARAEKVRQKELESRKDGPFKKELAGFVAEGKLNKTGGVEEVERQRKVREERARQEFVENMEKRRLEMARKKAGQQAPAPPTGDGPGQGPNENLAVPRPDGVGQASSPEVEFVEAKEVQA
jgi:Actin interacting protein 3